MFVISTLNISFGGISSDERNSQIPTRTIVYENDQLITDVADVSFYGENIDDNAKTTGTGDFNNDGYDDLLIGAPGFYDSRGKVYLFFGGKDIGSPYTNVNQADVSFLGEEFYDSAGSYVNGIGDVNGDGIDDLAISSPNNDESGERSGQTYIFFGRENQWESSYSLSEADASFLGEGYMNRVSIGREQGDANGDGFYDIIINAPDNDQGGTDAGKVYIIFGKENGWSMDTPLSNADASFLGEEPGDRLFRGSFLGDINGDGIDDISAGSPNNDEWGEDTGQVYVIFGKREGWQMNFSISNANVSLHGENDEDASSWAGPIGDTNGDGYDDFMISIHHHDYLGPRTGKVCMFFGKKDGWEKDISLSTSDASFVGEAAENFAGFPHKLGDINGDGFDDFSIEAYWNSEGGYYSGQVYGFMGGDKTWGHYVNISNSDLSIWGKDIPSDQLQDFKLGGDFDGDGNDDLIVTSHQKEDEDRKGMVYLIYGTQFQGPEEVISLKSFSDISYSMETDKVDIGQKIFLELIGIDGNISNQDYTGLNLTCSSPLIRNRTIRLMETGYNTGIYRGFFTCPINIHYLINFTFTSIDDPEKTLLITVHTPVLIEPIVDNKNAIEDKQFFFKYWNFGYASPVIWTIEADRDWIKWDSNTQEINGIPNNNDVGDTWVRINLSDDLGHFDEHYFKIIVMNIDPTIIGTPITDIDQNMEYYFDFDSDDDGQGNLTWKLGTWGDNTDVDWLSIDPKYGVLSGIPSQENVGTTWASITVNDGNGGFDALNFRINVSNVNDPPQIITEDVIQIMQNDPFVRNYIAEDIDIDDELRWALHTDAEFLSIDEEMGTLSGTPGPLDVGSYFVKVSVWDLADAFDFHNFTLTVIDINDVPIWIDFPPNTQIKHGSFFLFDANAMDYDGGQLTYSISSTPASDITIDPVTGLINWTANIHLFDSEPYRLEVKVSVFDGSTNSTRTFTITVLPTKSPSVDLIGPNDGVRTSSSATVLKWEGFDPEDETITYDIYLHQTEAFVQGLREEALYESDYAFDNITLDSLEQGSTYFWTIIPHDGCSYGICTSGVQSFRVNYKPTFKNIENHQVPAGTDFKFKISCTDEDTEDLPNLRYSLIEAPEGMTISEDTGMIRWTPDDDQVMLHIVTVGVSDGIEMNTATFEIEVTEGESTASTLIITIAVVLIVVLLIAFGIFFFIKKKRELDEEALLRGEEERASLEKEREEEYASYEELYGIPAPEKDEEELTTRELKEYIHEKIEELEGSD